MSTLLLKFTRAYSVTPSNSPIGSVPFYVNYEFGNKAAKVSTLKCNFRKYNYSAQANIHPS